MAEQNITGKQTDAIKFLNRLTEKAATDEAPPDLISNTKLMEFINIVDEKTMDLIGAMGNDVTRLLINITGLVRLLIDREIITEEDFNLAVQAQVYEFQKTIEESNKENKETSAAVDNLEI